MLENYQDLKIYMLSFDFDVGATAKCYCWTNPTKSPKALLGLFAKSFPLELYSGGIKILDGCNCMTSLCSTSNLALSKKGLLVSRFGCRRSKSKRKCLPRLFHLLIPPFFLVHHKAVSLIIIINNLSPASLFLWVVVSAHQHPHGPSNDIL